MKRILLFIALFISVSSFAAPWDIAINQQQIKTLPNVIYTDAYVWNKSYTPSGKDELVIILDFDDFTGNYTSRALVSVYGYYRHTQLGWPQVYWQWDYKQFTIDVPPNSHDYSYRYVPQTGESFHMSGNSISNGQGEWISSSDTRLDSYVQL